MNINKYWDINSVICKLLPRVIGRKQNPSFTNVVYIRISVGKNHLGLELKLINVQSLQE